MLSKVLSVNNSPPYIGRFAPSPTGKIHFGTLVTATASYLQSKAKQGIWLLRMDDIDTTRVIKNADQHIIKTLQRYGFTWQNNIFYQSKNQLNYQQALTSLINQKLIFPCRCSRKLLAEQAKKSGTNIYPGTCRNQNLPEHTNHILRIRSQNQIIRFQDSVMGWQQQNVAEKCGDFIIKRRDGLFAYQLAVVVDDAIQGVTEIVRGADLLDSTPRQIYLQQRLNYPQLAYLHIPLAVDKNNQKLSKSTGAANIATYIESGSPQHLLVRVLRFLGQNPPQSLRHSSISNLWLWAIQHWNIAAIPRQKTIIVR